MEKPVACVPYSLPIRELLGVVVKALLEGCSSELTWSDADYMYAEGRLARALPDLDLSVSGQQVLLRVGRTRLAVDPGDDRCTEPKRGQLTPRLRHDGHDPVGPPLRRAGSRRGAARGSKGASGPLASGH